MVPQFLPKPLHWYCFQTMIVIKRSFLFDLFLFVMATVAVSLANLLRKSPPTVLRKALGEPIPSAQEDEIHFRATEGLELNIARAVQRAAKYVPWGKNCLAQAVGAYWLLRFFGRGSKVVIGLRQDSDDRSWEAHAWLVSESGWVVGGGIPERFVAATSFSKDLRLNG